MRNAVLYTGVREGKNGIQHLTTLGGKEENRDAIRSSRAPPYARVYVVPVPRPIAAPLNSVFT